MTRAAIILRLVRAYWAYRRRVEVPAGGQGPQFDGETVRGEPAGQR